MKKVLITGGATGIGKAAAQLFCEKEFEVFVTVHHTQLDYDGVVPVQCDVCDEAQVRALFDTIGTVQVLVNSAGVSLIAQIQDTTGLDYDRVMDVNCRGTFLCCREAAKKMLPGHSGKIINIASVWGEVGASCEAVYSASKAAVIGLTKALSKELAPSGITVNCVSPGIIDTRMNSAFSKAELVQEVPLGRLGTPREVAEAVFFFAESDYVTGQVLGANGAMI